MAARWAPVLGFLILLPLLPSASSSSMVFKLDGNVYPDGHFYVTMNIGEKEKEKPYFLDIDTGSNLSWLECDAGHGTCETCDKVPHPLYQLISKKPVPCAHSLCDAMHQDLGSTKECMDEPRQCDYEIHYFDGASSLGVLVTDKFSFSMGHRVPSKHYDIAFGCGYDQVKKGHQKKVSVDGILGLGRGSVDFVSQLKGQGLITKNLIHHCLSATGGGYLVLGEHELPPSRITWVPMAPKIPGKPNHYSPGKATLQLDTKSVDTKPVQVVFDSGSTYTHLPLDLFKLLVSKMGPSISKSLKLVKDDPALHLCWKRPGGFKSSDDLKKEFKSVMSFKFGTGATMMIPPENYLVITERGNACLGMLWDEKLDMITVGDITLHDQLVTYDNERGMLGWMRSTCSSPPTAHAIDHPPLAVSTRSLPTAGGEEVCNSVFLASGLTLNCHSDMAVVSQSCCMYVLMTMDKDERCLCNVVEDEEFTQALSVRAMWNLYKMCGGRQEQVPKDPSDCNHMPSPSPPPLPASPPPSPPSPPSHERRRPKLSPLTVAGVVACATIIVCAGVGAAAAVLKYRAESPVPPVVEAARPTSSSIVVAMPRVHVPTLLLPETQSKGH